MCKMSTSSEHDPTLIFRKFKDYFDAKLNSISKPHNHHNAFKELELKLEAKNLTKPGNIAPYKFCGQLEIFLSKIKSAIQNEEEPGTVLQSVEGAMKLISDRKQKIRIADSSKAGWGTISQLDKTEADKLSSEQHKKVLAAEEAAFKEIERRKRQRHDAPQPPLSHRPAPDHPDRFLFRGTVTETIYPLQITLLCYTHCIMNPPKSD